MDVDDGPPCFVCGKLRANHTTCWERMYGLPGRDCVLCSVPVDDWIALHDECRDCLKMVDGEYLRDEYGQ